jgi:hypothetical protein
VIPSPKAVEVNLWVACKPIREVMDLTCLKVHSLLQWAERVTKREPEYKPFRLMPGSPQGQSEKKWYN